MAQAHSESVEKHKPVPASKPVEQPAAPVIAPSGDANLIGSPDVFLTDRHRELPRGSVRIHQVAADGPHRAYVITEGSKLGYFHLSEGMSRPDAESALAHAFDGTAVVL